MIWLDWKRRFSVAVGSSGYFNNKIVLINLVPLSIFKPFILGIQIFLVL